MEVKPRIVFSATLKKYAFQACESKKCGENLKISLRELLGSDSVETITFDLVKKISETLRSDNEGVSLHKMLEGCSLFLNTIHPHVQNPALEARLKILKIEQANKEYKEMTRNVNSIEKHKTEKFGEEIKTLNRQLIAVFNFIVTVGGAFAFAYKVVEYSVGESLPLQMMFGLIVATVVFLADLYFLVRYNV